MEIESQLRHEVDHHDQQQVVQPMMGKRLRRALVGLNFTAMVVGYTAGPLLMRDYFLHGGHRKWLSSWLQTSGCPLVLIPLVVSYLYRRRHDKRARAYVITPKLLLASAVIGLLVGVDNFLYAYGMSYLPVSTSSILLSTQLGFTALFAFLLVRQRFTPFSVNAVALLSFGALILGLHSSGDRPKGVTKAQYYLGFLMMLSAAALYAFVLPAVELAYSVAKRAVTYTLVMEMQLVMSVVATVFCTVAMAARGDFQLIAGEAKAFGVGETNYYLLLVCSAVLWQLSFLGTVGTIHYTSALVSGVILTFLIPVTEVLAVVFFRESFNSDKGVALALSLWGFASYFYGEWLATKKKTTAATTAAATTASPAN